ncbi:MAG: type II secretion system protein GspD [Planctomycetes bacterium]|nr:type II secretion system protein GspD [Planctomycetota bacterium]
MIFLIKKKQRKTTVVILLALLSGIFVHIAAAGEFDVSDSDINEIVMVNNVWVDVPLGQILRDISIETGVIIATCPHMPDPLISLDAGIGKPLKECISELVAGQGLFIYQRSKKFYLISCGDPTCPSALETTTSKRLYLKYITAKHLKGSLPKFSQKYVTSGERDNEILIYALPDITKHIMDIIHKLDVPREQVMLEVLVVDLWEDTSDELGLDWSYSGPHTSFSMAGGTAGFTGLASYASVAASNLTGLSLTLRALVAEKRASIRSRPRVATLNGEKATIDISLEEYFTIATDIYGSSLRTELEVIKSGVLLEMTPHIGDDGYITVDVLTEVSDVASRRNSSGNNSISGADLPVIRRRKADTRVRVKEGDAIVIGGLIESQETTNHKRVPLLSSIPLMGGLFKSKEDATVKKEVVIFIIPRLMNEGEIALSDRHEMIDEVEEVEKLRDVATLFDVRHKYDQKTDSNDQEIQYLKEAKNLLGAQDQSHTTSHKTDSAAVTYPDNIAQERKALQEVIALLDIKNEQMRPVIAERKKNKKYEASYGVISK